MGYRVRDVRKALCVKLKAGEDRSRRHLTYEVVDDQGVLLGQTYISHGISDINDPLLGKMARQLNIRRSDFAKLIDCELYRSDYIRLASCY